MPWITETIWPAVLIGLVLEIVLAVMVVASGRGRLLGAMIGVLVVTLGLVAVERFVVTEREEVALALDAVAAALTTNDFSQVLAHVSQSKSAAPTRAAAQANLGRVVIRTAEVGSDLKIDLQTEAQPPTATARFVARFSGSDKSGQASFDKYVQRLEVNLVKEDGQWRIATYKLLPFVGGQNRRDE